MANQATVLPQNPYVLARSVNSTDSSFVSKVVTVTEPTGDGVISLSNPAFSVSYPHLRLLPIGAGSDNNTFSVRVIGWKSILDSANVALWIPTTLCEYLCTLSTFVGVVGTVVLNTQRFADTVSLVINMGTDGQNTTLFSPQNNTPAWVTVSTDGCQKAEVLFSTGSSATGCNALVHAY